MKKKYLQPRTKTFSVRPSRMMAGSIKGSIKYEDASGTSDSGITNNDAKGDDGNFGW